MNGSATLLVMLLLAAITAICLRQGFTGTVLVEIAAQKEKVEQRFWLAQGLLECGIVMGKKKWEALLEQLAQKKKKMMILSIPSWPPEGDDRYRYHGQLALHKIAEEKIKIVAALLAGDKKMAGQCCVLSKSGEIFAVTEWGVV